MKKTLLLFVVIITVFSLVACETETSKSEKYCWSCGGDITKQAVFCEHCGISLKESSTEATSKDSATEESTKPETTPSSICNHSWKNATCTTPRTCEKCSLTEGKANGHWWYEATCTDARMCTVCLAEDPGSEPLGHIFVQGKCERCGEDDPNSVDKIVETITASKSSLSIDKNTTISIEVICNENNYPDGISLDATYDDDIVEIEWGDWDEWTIPLTIIPIQDGTATIRISVSEDSSKYQDIVVTVTGQNNYQLSIDGIGEEYRLYYPYVLEADVFLLHSAEYDITYYPWDNTMWVEVEVIVETIENNVINSNYIGIEYELYNDNGICVQTGNVWIDANYSNRKYSQVLQFLIDTGDYTLVFKDMYM